MTSDDRAGDDDLDAMLRPHAPENATPREHAWITPKVMGPDGYAQFCRKASLPLIEGGYGALLCVTPDDERWTMFTRDLKFHARLVKSRSRKNPIVLPIPRGMYPTAQPGWPDDWPKEHVLRDTDAFADAMAMCFSRAGGNGPDDDGAQYIMAGYIASGDAGGPGMTDLVEGMAQFVTVLAGALGTRGERVPVGGIDENGGNQHPASVIKAFIVAHAAGPETPPTV